MDKNKSSLQGFARRISTLRHEAGETLEEVGRAAGVQKDSTCAYEAGRREPKAGVLCALAKHYNVTPEWLWSGRDRNSHKNPIADLSTGETNRKSEKAKMAAEIAAMAYQMSPKNAKILRVLAKELS